jgi:hypothetical protein
MLLSVRTVPDYTYIWGLSVLEFGATEALRGPYPVVESHSTFSVTLLASYSLRCSTSHHLPSPPYLDFASCKKWLIAMGEEDDEEQLGSFIPHTFEPPLKVGWVEV